MSDGSFKDVLMEGFRDLKGMVGRKSPSASIQVDKIAPQPEARSDLSRSFIQAYSDVNQLTPVQQENLMLSYRESPTWAIYLKGVEYGAGQARNEFVSGNPPVVTPKALADSYNQMVAQLRSFDALLNQSLRDQAVLARQAVEAERQALWDAGYRQALSDLERRTREPEGKPVVRRGRPRKSMEPGVEQDFGDEAGGTEPGVRQVFESAGESVGSVVEALR